MATPGGLSPPEVPNSEAELTSSDIHGLRAALAAEMKERKTMERALSIAAKEVKNLRQQSASAARAAAAGTAAPPAEPATPPGDATQCALLDAQTQRAASLERQLAMSKEELKRLRASIVVSEHATQRRIADSLAARVEDATAAEAAALKAAKALDAERRAREKVEAALAAESERRAAAEAAIGEAKAEALRLSAELAGQAAAAEVHLVARLKAESEAAHHDGAIDDALREVTAQLARMRQAMDETSRSSVAQVLELTHRADDAERRLEAESKQRQAAEAAIVKAVQMRQRHQQAVEEGQSAAVSAAEEAASIALQRAHDESHRRMAAEQALAVANQELKWRREAAEQAGLGHMVPPGRPETPPAMLPSDNEPGSPASVMLHQRQELEFALAVASAEVKKWRALATSRTAGDAVVVAHHRDALEAERQQAARLQTALQAAQSQCAQLRTSEARAQAELESTKAQMDEEFKKRTQHEAALALAAQHIRRLQRDNQDLRSASITSDAAAASAASSSAAAPRMDEAAAASVAAANRERRLREDRAKAKVSGPDSAVAAAVAAAEAIAAAEAAAQQRRQHRAAEEARARETASAAMRAAADASAWVAQGGAGSRPPGFEAQERAWEVFVGTAGREGWQLIRASDIPWPDVATLVATLEADTKPGGLARPRSVTIAELRALQARWHPDRFAQRFGARLEPQEKDAILRRVTEVASRINALRGAQDE